jgi:uncharacterized protein (TIGR02996 family)
MAREDLLLAITESPEDDGVRLVFADWLEEYGDEVDRTHAELIRVQIALERLPPDGDSRGELAAREETRRYGEIVKVRKRLQVPSCVRPRLTRGFPECIGYDWNDPRKGRLSEDDLTQMAEAVYRLPIRVFAGDLLGCAASPASGRLPALGRSGLELLANWPPLARLTALEMSSNITPYEDRGNFAPGLFALAASPYAGGLRRLLLGGWQINAEALTAVASSPGLPRLAELVLGSHHHDMTDEALNALLTTPLVGRLERLSCDWVDAPPNTIAAWLGKAPLRHLIRRPGGQRGRRRPTARLGRIDPTSPTKHHR